MIAPTFSAGASIAQRLDLSIVGPQRRRLSDHLGNEVGPAFLDSFAPESGRLALPSEGLRSVDRSALFLDHTS
jgi:hypothetical protein